MPGEVTPFMWVCLFFGTIGWPLIFLGIDWIQDKRLSRRLRKEYEERNSERF